VAAGRSLALCPVDSGRTAQLPEAMAPAARMARSHVERGDAALASGRRLTAGDAYLGAGPFAVWQQVAPLLDPPMSILEVPFENLTLPGYQRISAGVTRPPVLIMFPGEDSVKEELYNLGGYIIARGLAFAAFDGPRQGNGELRGPLRPDYERVIPAVIDSLAGRDDLDTSRLAVAGICYVRDPYGRHRRLGRRGGVDLELVHPGPADLSTCRHC
jgi:hypothetical protein